MVEPERRGRERRRPPPLLLPSLRNAIRVFKTSAGTIGRPSPKSMSALASRVRYVAPPVTPTPSPNSPSSAPSQAAGCAATAALLGGILVFMLGLGLLGSEFKHLAWRLKARFWYQQGVARIEKTDILFREGAYELETTFRLEWGGQIGKSTAHLDPDDPSTVTKEASAQRAARTPIGSLQPCWYWPPDPENYNVLAPQGLGLGAAWVRLLIPAVVLLVAWEIAGWGWRRVKKWPAAETSS